jgi:hypothetical protein
MAASLRSEPFGGLLDRLRERLEARGHSAAYELEME